VAFASGEEGYELDKWLQAPSSEPPSQSSLGSPGVRVLAKALNCWGQSSAQVPSCGGGTALSGMGHLQDSKNFCPLWTLSGCSSKKKNPPTCYRILSSELEFKTGTDDKNKNPVWLEK